MNKTLATQLSEKLGVDKPQLSPPLERRPGIKNRIERSGKLPKLSKGNVVPWTQTLGLKRRANLRPKTIPGMGGIIGRR